VGERGERGGTINSFAQPFPFAEKGSGVGKGEKKFSQGRSTGGRKKKRKHVLTPPSLLLLDLRAQREED